MNGYAPVNGIKMYYEVYGEGSVPLVLVHGGGSTIQTSFGNLIPYLGNRKIIAVELQAHGRTEDRDAPESFEQDADDIVTLLRYLDIQKADFLGFSNGGTTVLEIAATYPEIAGSVVAIAAVWERAGMVSGFFEGMKNVTISDMPMPLKEGYLKVGKNDNGLLTMFEKDKQRMLNFKDRDENSLKGIKAPTLLISNDRDVILPGHTLKIAQLIPNARVALLPGYHGTCIGEVCSVPENIDYIGQTAAYINDFLDGRLA